LKEVEDEEELKKLRERLHNRLGLPLNRPALRVGQALAFGEKESKAKAGGPLPDVHLGLGPSGVAGGTVHLIDGSYDYFHYMQVHSCTQLCGHHSPAHHCVHKMSSASFHDIFLWTLAPCICFAYLLLKYLWHMPSCSLQMSWGMRLWREAQTMLPLSYSSGRVARRYRGE
jgi:hypothetical protein